MGVEEIKGMICLAIGWIENEDFKSVKGNDRVSFKKDYILTSMLERKSLASSGP